MQIDGILRDAGVPRHAHLVVHSAFSGFGRQGWQARDVISAMRDHVQDGGLLMPTMTWRTVTPERPDWDELTTPSHTGILTEIFRREFAAVRSIHPTHSVAGFGRNVKALLSRHHIDDTPVSQNSPYGLLRDYETHVLMLGVGLESCTAIHLPEETIAEALYVRDETVIYKCCSSDGMLHHVAARRHHSLDRNFPKFEAPLSAMGQIRGGVVGDTRWMAVRMQDLFRVVFEALLHDQRATLRIA